MAASSNHQLSNIIPLQRRLRLGQLVAVHLHSSHRAASRWASVAGACTKGRREQQLDAFTWIKTSVASVPMYSMMTGPPGCSGIHSVMSNTCGHVEARSKRVLSAAFGMQWRWRRAAACSALPAMLLGVQKSSPCMLTSDLVVHRNPGILRSRMLGHLRERERRRGGLERGGGLERRGRRRGSLRLGHLRQASASRACYASLAASVGGAMGACKRPQSQCREPCRFSNDTSPVPPSHTPARTPAGTPGRRVRPREPWCRSLACFASCLKPASLCA